MPLHEPVHGLSGAAGAELASGAPVLEVDPGDAELGGALAGADVVAAVPAEPPSPHADATARIIA